jgi:hypothetical protein
VRKSTISGRPCAASVGTSWPSVASTESRIASCTWEVAQDRKTETAIANLEGDYEFHTCVQDAVFSGTQYPHNLQGVQAAASMCQYEIQTRRERLTERIVFKVSGIAFALFVLVVVVASRKQILSRLYRTFVSALAIGIRADKARKRFLGNAVRDAEAKIDRT